MNNWFFLICAVVCEVVATLALKASNEFTKLFPSLIVASGYIASFYFLSMTLRTIPIGIAYAIWSGLGVTLITLIGWIYYGQSLDKVALLGMGLIVIGSVVLNLSLRSH